MALEGRANASEVYARLSTVALIPELSGAPQPDPFDRAVARLRAWREEGVTTFDVAGAQRPSLAVALVAAAFPEPDRDLTVVVPSADPVAARRRPGSRPDPTLTAARPNAGPSFGVGLDRFRVIVEVEGQDDPFPSRPESDHLLRQYGFGLGEGRIAFRCTTRDQVRWARRGTDRPILTTEFSLLNRGVLDDEIVREPGPIPACLVRNVFAGGRLDGSRWTSEPTPSVPAGRPPSLRELRADYDELLGLAFLTERRGRTLAEAAVAFVLSAPWVVSVALPLPVTERAADLVRRASSLKLTPEEIARIRDLPARRPILRSAGF